MIKHVLLLLLVIALLALARPAFAYKAVEFVSEFGGKGETLGKFSDKTRFDFDKDGNIYVVDTEYLRVQKLTPDGNPIMEIAYGDEVPFARPMDVAVDGDLNIYVADWNAVHIQGTDSPKIFNYGPCVLKFSSEGKYVATFTLEDLSKKTAETERAVPAVDTDGKFALMIVPEKTDRSLYICADSEGNIYALDQDAIYKLSSSGKILARFAGPDYLDKATDIAVDTEGNVYVADTGNNRISKFDSGGKFLLSFGKKGETDGRLTGSLYVTAAPDGTVLVADSARYEKVFKTSMKHRKTIGSAILATGQDDPLIPRRRNFVTVIRRVQRFDSEGKFREKILYRIDRSDPELRDMEFKAVDPDGNLYLINKDRLTVRKYSVQSPVRWSEVEKSLSGRFLHNRSYSQIDNFYDLDSFIDFEERERYTQLSVTMRLSYDMTETLRVSLVNSLMNLRVTTYDSYPGEYTGYIQDDEMLDNYTAFRTRVDFSLILNHDPFKYRVANLFAYFGGGKYDFSVKALDFSNQRRLDQRLWWSVWAMGARYDMGSSMRLSLIASQHRPPGFMNYEYEYWDESGELTATGFGGGASTEVLMSLDGAF